MTRYTVKCRTCGAEPLAQCVSLTSGRVTDTHVARITDQYPLVPRQVRCENGHVTLPDGLPCHVCGADVLERAPRHVVPPAAEAP